MADAATSAVTAARTAMAAEAAAVPFSDDPGGARDAVHDFTKGHGQKLWGSATTGLTTPYNGSPEGMYIFLGKMNKHAKNFGFESVLDITAGAVTHHMTTEFGTLTTELVNDHGRTFMNVEGRERQNANILRTWIENSLDETTMMRLQQHKANYVLSFPGANANDPVIKRESGPSMLFQLIKEVMVETRFTVSDILLKLSDLVPLMEKCKYDIPKFHLEINTLLLALMSREATIPNIIPALFRAYEAVADAEFSPYTKRKEEDYHDPTLATVELTYQGLMAAAHEKYKIIDGQHKWLKKSDAQLEFIAMKAEFAATKKKLQQNDHQTGTGGGGGGQPPKRNGPRPNEGKWAWKGLAPKTGEPHEKKVDDKWYLYCPHHGPTKWVLKINRQGIDHATGCRAAAEAAQGAGGAEAETPAVEERSSDDLRMARALAMIMATENL